MNDRLRFLEPYLLHLPGIQQYWLVFGDLGFVQIVTRGQSTLKCSFFFVFFFRIWNFQKLVNVAGNIFTRWLSKVLPSLDYNLSAKKFIPVKIRKKQRKSLRKDLSLSEKQTKTPWRSTNFPISLPRFWPANNIIFAAKYYMSLLKKFIF